MSIENKKTILLVEDEAVTSIVTSKTLKKFGYNVFAVETGEMAIETAKSNNNINLILMDIDLGKGIDGTDAAAIILKDREIPVVFLSSHTEPEIVEKTEKITSYGYVVKNSGNTVLDASIKMAFKLFEAMKREKDKEAKLHESEEKYRNLIVNISDLIYEIDSRGVIKYLSPSVKELLGYDSNDAIGKNFIEFVYEDDRSQLIKRFSELKDGIEIPLEYRFIKKTGDVIWVRTRTKPIYKDGVFSGANGLLIDITERKQAEEAIKTKDEELTASLEEMEAANEDLIAVNDELYAKENELRVSETRLIQAEKIAKIGHWTLKLDSKMMVASNGAHDIYGLDFQETTLAEIQKIPLPEYRNLLDKALSDLITKSTPYDLEFKICRPSDGAIVDIHSVASFDKKTNTVFGVVQDITERKQAEEMLNASEEKFAKAFRYVPALITISSIEDGMYIEVNNEFVKISGFSREEAIGRTSIELGWLLPSDRTRLIETLRAQGSIKDLELDLYAKDKHIVKCLFNGEIIILNGKPFLLSLARDITERKQLEKNMLNNERKFVSVFNNNPHMMTIAEVSTGLLLDANEAFIRESGFSLSELVGRTTIDLGLISLEDREAAKQQMQTNGEISGLEVLLRRKNGSRFWVLYHGKLIVIEGKQVLLSTSHDITERKRSEYALRESEEKYRLLHENSGIGIGYYKLDGTIISYNRLAASHMNGLPEDFISKSIYDIFTKQDAEFYHNRIKNAAYSDNPVVYEDLVPLPSGNKYFLSTFVKITDLNNNILGIQIISQDITEIKQAEDKIKQLLEEKELILREVHHRIKNNMNTIHGLLVLQADTLKDRKAIAALEDSANRVQSMMVLYDKLYRSTDVQNISIKDYLPSLVDEIIVNFPNSKSVKIEKKIDDFVLDAKRLHPLGIIINELLTNIMKSAFIGRDDGLIKISASLKGKNVSIIIQDNGNSIPETVDFENSTGFGLQLVWMLTKDLQGTIKIEREQGTKIVLEFEI